LSSKQDANTSSRGSRASGVPPTSSPEEPIASRATSLRSGPAKCVRSVEVWPGPPPCKCGKPHRSRHWWKSFPHRRKPAEESSQCGRRSRPDVGGRRKTAGKKIVDCLVGDHISDHVPHDERDKVRRSEGSEGLMCFSFVRPEGRPSRVGGQNVRPLPVPLGPPATGLRGERSRESGNDNGIVRVDVEQ
jgi:hypothetical protein